MDKGFTWRIFLPAAILLLATLSAAGIKDDHISAREATDREASAGPSVTSGISTAPSTLLHNDYPTHEIKDTAEGSTDARFPFRLFVTPEDEAIEALAAQISSPRDAYQVAVQWTYVSEQRLNQATDRWLTPGEFLTDTPHYPSNPLQGEGVSDCEEQANALVSLIRAEGIRPEEVRVALGEVEFGGVTTGHAWAELLTDEGWLALDPSWGPYWDDKAEKLVCRQGVPFDYYASHAYPVREVWIYYNDTYDWDQRTGSGNAPDSWHQAAPAN